jgi:hypothetical protein
MNAMLGAADDGLRKHHTPLRVHSAVGDPVLVAEGGGAVDVKGAGAGLPGGSRLHLHCVVACRKQFTRRGKDLKESPQLDKTSWVVGTYVLGSTQLSPCAHLKSGMLQAL